MKLFGLCAALAVAASVPTFDEFCAQGDKEKQLGIPVQMLNDRVKVNRPFSQIGFIEFLVAPLLFAFVKVATTARALRMHAQMCGHAFVRASYS